MNVQRTIVSARLLPVAYLLSLIAITSALSTVTGSSTKRDDWLSIHNQQIYSELTGTIRELTSNDNTDDTDTRFQPPLYAKNQNIQPIEEGYRLAGTEVLAHRLPISTKKDKSHELRKRDVLSNNSSMSTGPLQSKLSNEENDDGSLLSDANVNAWALSLSLVSPAFDGSGSEFETTSETVITDVTSASTLVQLTTLSPTEQSTDSTLTTNVSETISTTIPSVTTEVSGTVSATETTTATGSSETITSGQADTSETSSTAQTSVEQSTSEIAESSTLSSTTVVSVTENSSLQITTESSTEVTATESETEASIISTVTIPTTSSISVSSESTSETTSSTEPTMSTSYVETSTQSLQQQTTIFFLYFTPTSSSARKVRSVPVGSPTSSTLENEISNVLYGMNITCNDTCVQINQTNINPPDIEYLITLNVSLDVSERIALVNGLFMNNVSLNDSYLLTVRIIMNPNTSDFLNFTSVIPVCKECEYSFTGNCTTDNSSCVCYPNYQGQFCQDFVQPTSSYLSTTTTSGTSTTSTSSALISTITSTASTMETEISSQFVSTSVPSNETTETTLLATTATAEITSSSETIEVTETTGPTILNATTSTLSTIIITTEYDTTTATPEASTENISMTNIVTTEATSYTDTLSTTNFSETLGEITTVTTHITSMPTVSLSTTETASVTTAENITTMEFSTLEVSNTVVTHQASTSATSTLTASETIAASTYATSTPMVSSNATSFSNITVATELTTPLNTISTAETASSASSSIITSEAFISVGMSTIGTHTSSSTLIDTTTNSGTIQTGTFETSTPFVAFSSITSASEIPTSSANTGVMNSVVTTTVPSEASTANTTTIEAIETEASESPSSGTGSSSTALVSELATSTSTLTSTASITSTAASGTIATGTAAIFSTSSITTITATDTTRTVTSESSTLASTASTHSASEIPTSGANTDITGSVTATTVSGAVPAITSEASTSIGTSTSITGTTLTETFAFSPSTTVPISVTSIGTPSTTSAGGLSSSLSTSTNSEISLAMTNESPTSASTSNLTTPIVTPTASGTVATGAETSSLTSTLSSSASSSGPTRTIASEVSTPASTLTTTPAGTLETSTPATTSSSITSINIGSTNGISATTTNTIPSSSVNATITTSSAGIATVEVSTAAIESTTATTSELYLSSTQTGSTSSHSTTNTGITTASETTEPSTILTSFTFSTSPATSKDSSPSAPNTVLTSSITATPANTTTVLFSTETSTSYTPTLPDNTSNAITTANQSTLGSTTESASATISANSSSVTTEMPLSPSTSGISASTTSTGITMNTTLIGAITTQVSTNKIITTTDISSNTSTTTATTYPASTATNSTTTTSTTTTSVSTSTTSTTATTTDTASTTTSTTTTTVSTSTTSTTTTTTNTGSTTTTSTTTTTTDTATTTTSTTTTTVSASTTSTTTTTSDTGSTTTTSTTTTTTDTTSTTTSTTTTTVNTSTTSTTTTTSDTGSTTTTSTTTTTTDTASTTTSTTTTTVSTSTTSTTTTTTDTATTTTSTTTTTVGTSTTSTTTTTTDTATTTTSTTTTTVGTSTTSTTTTTTDTASTTTSTTTTTVSTSTTSTTTTTTDTATTTTSTTTTTVSTSTTSTTTTTTDTASTTTSTTTTTVSMSTTSTTTTTTDTASTTTSTTTTTVSTSTTSTTTTTTDTATTTTSTTTATVSVSTTSTATTTTDTGSTTTTSTITTTTDTASTTTSATITTSTSTVTSTTTSTSTSSILSSTTTMATSTSTTTVTTATTTTTTVARNCAWTNWVPIGNCSPSCGVAYQQVVRACVDSFSGQSCSSSDCGGGNATQNQLCVGSPPCETITATLTSSIRDPNLETFSYTLPNTMEFFGQSINRLWIANKGYVGLGAPFYGQTMTQSAFPQLAGQTIAAPFWADLSYDSTYSNITVSWFNSINASQSDASVYYPIIQRTISEACPTKSCSLNFAASRAVRIEWQNLFYQLPENNQSISLTFSAFLIDTYETSTSSYPILRSYLSFDYSNLTSNLGSLRPFVGFRGGSSLSQVLNDPSYKQNAAFLKQASHKSFYIGGRFLTQCEVSYLQEAAYNALNPSENLNDIINNPRIPCPCTLSQAQNDRRFNALQSETIFEWSQSIVCYGPMVINRIRVGGISKSLRAQTCCYKRNTGVLLTSGDFAGSVLSNPNVLFRSFPWQRRSQFHDQCCSPVFFYGPSVNDPCRLYYQIHPTSSCSGYEQPGSSSGVGDPHIDTIDNGRYTCHVQGLFVLAQTTTAAKQIAQANLNNINVSDSSLIYPEDLFYIYVRSASIAPALPYVERMQGSASIFSSYIIGAANYTFVISNLNGKFGFTASNSLQNISLTDVLANNLNYDSANTTNVDDIYMYRVRQMGVSVSNTTVPQLTFALWSGLSIQCQITAENLECILLLPDKYRSLVEGLAGNFNGMYGDDLVNRRTNQTISILSANNQSAAVNDVDVLNACLSWRAPNDTTANITNPILPSTLVNWYYNNASSVLTTLNSHLSQSEVNQTCSSNFECVHDYIVRINPITSGATALLLDSYRDSRATFAETVPTVNISSTVQIPLPYYTQNRTYSLPISISGASSTLVTISRNGTIQNSAFQGSSIDILIPSTTDTYVDVSLTITYGTNSTIIQYLNIIACLCINSSYCNYAQTTIISENYAVASCDCPDQYDGIFCQLSYDGCNSTSACRINWNNGTQCIPLSPAQQLAQNQSYICNGTCSAGYKTRNQYTCEDENECQTNSSRCGNGTCVNLIGSFTCDCLSGYRFESGTCVAINNCIEPYTNGTYSSPCNESQECVYSNGHYTCSCSLVFNTTGTCVYNASLCVNDTCTSNVDNNTISCLHGTVKENNTCIPWCQSTCPGFCELVNGLYQCNCMKQAGLQYSIDGKQCIPCENLNYGYGCNETCLCNFGTCNANATSANESCTCDPGYEPPFCSKQIDQCANNTVNTTQKDCLTDPSTGRAVLICAVGYQLNSTSNYCTDINECSSDLNQCNVGVSVCVNTIGSYQCNCLTGYQLINNSCVDINECATGANNCSSYSNTYCANIQGSFECRCNYNYSLGGDYTQQYGNAISSNSSCLPTDYSVYCENQCEAPANCSAITGRCECPSSNYKLVDSALDETRQTCQCPNHPFTYYNGSDCVNATGQTWLLLFFKLKASSRVISIDTPASSSIQTNISYILSGMNITCNGSCINLYDTQDASPPNLELMVTLNVLLNVTQRINLVNALFDDNVVYNDSYSLSLIKIIMNPATNTLVNVTAPEPACRECVYTGVGVCWDNQTSCTCFSGYEGYLCRVTTVTPTLGSSSSGTNWTVIVAVVSAIAGLLLIIALAMCVFYFIKNRQPSDRDVKVPVQRPQFVIPRAHIPTMGTGSRALNTWDAFSLDNTYDEQYVDASDSFPSSSSTTYNTTYRANGQRPEADFGIFDELENRIPMSKGHIPRPQMVNILGTLNSLPSNERFDEPSGAESTFSDSRELDDIELVTDMLDDMTKDDDMEDEFVEALNPNLAIPRLALQPENHSSGWFPFFRNS
ncbi:unnamed protein product [Adineta ricciae]|uniref:EGF-like domain-containing protein n=1 Tax=Adineta ricciae TaxID=249248 RepID=A0A813XJN7_ADIRI|nr:unnamed protein product [Adineta ricciae]